MAEDDFDFEASLYFNQNNSLFNYKANERSKWVLDDNISKLQIVYTDAQGYLVSTSLNTGNMMIREFCRQNQPVVYPDIVRQNWVLGNENKMLEGLNCKSAHTVFRGRKYTAWYTLDIPSAAGPWKFNGLPGLIVAVEDAQKEVNIILTSVKLLAESEDKSVDFSKSDIKSREEVLQCLDKAYAEFYNKNRANIAKLQAEFPDLIITNNNLPAQRPRTEFE